MSLVTQIYGFTQINTVCTKMLPKESSFRQCMIYDNILRDYWERKH